MRCSNTERVVLAAFGTDKASAWSSRVGGKLLLPLPPFQAGRGTIRPTPELLTVRRRLGENQEYPEGQRSSLAHVGGLLQRGLKNRPMSRSRVSNGAAIRSWQGNPNQERDTSWNKAQEFKASLSLNTELGNELACWSQ